MSDEEIAFYDALEVNNSVVKVLGDQRLRQIALELVDAVRKWVGDPDASAYELLFSFPSPEEKNEFLNLVRSNEDLGNDYIIEFTQPTTEEIRSARPLAMVLPQDALTQVMLIAATLCAGTEDDRAVS
jgi:hypothetical protein